MGAALWIAVARHVGIAVGLTAVAAVLIAWLLWRMLRGADRRMQIAALSLALVITVCAGTLGALCLQALDGYEEALTAAYEVDLDEAVANHP